MSLYFNETHKKGIVQLGPYTFKNGYIRTSPANDQTIGRILTQFYGCVRLTDEEEKAKNDEWASKKDSLTDAQKAQIHKELQEKADADKADAAKTAADAAKVAVDAAKTADAEKAKVADAVKPKA